MCEEAYRIFNLPQEDAAMVLIKVMDAGSSVRRILKESIQELQKI